MLSGFNWLQFTKDIVVETLQILLAILKLFFSVSWIVFREMWYLWIIIIFLLALKYFWGNKTRKHQK